MLARKQVLQTSIKTSIKIQDPYARSSRMGFMRPIAVASILLAAALGAPAVASGGDGTAEAPLVRMRDGHGSDLLFRLNPRTLQQVGRPLRTFRGGSDLKIS